MGRELDLMDDYPRTSNRLSLRPRITHEDRAVARRFGREYFDGERKHGYGGFSYHPRFWSSTVAAFVDHYQLDSASRILDVGCAKGFMLKDFRHRLPNAELAGVDVSEYAIMHADPEVASSLVVGDARALPFEDKTFDLVISINTVHNLDRSDCRMALSEIERVSRGDAFVMVDGWRTHRQHEMLDAWVLTAITMMHADDWTVLFAEAGYTGDYAFWTVE